MTDSSHPNQTSFNSTKKSNALVKFFTDHPSTVDETYFEHMRFAGWFSWQLFVAAMAALVHAFIPALCESTASTRIKKLHARITNRDHSGADH